MPGVTKEQIRQAREADLFAYLERHERGVLKRDGPNYRHREHDSLVYTPLLDRCTLYRKMVENQNKVDNWKIKEVSL